MTEFKATLGERLMDASADVAYVLKDGTNTHFDYSFVTEAKIKARVGAALRKHGLFISVVGYEIQESLSQGFSHIVLSGKDGVQVLGKATPNIIVQCHVTIRGVGLVQSSDYAMFTGLGQGSDNADKAAMKACAAALKYALTSGFLIATGDDPETDVSTDKAAEEPPAVVEEPKKRPSARAEKPSEPELSLPLALSMVAAAKDTGELSGLSIKLKGLKELLPREGFDELKKAFVARQAELKEKG